MVNANAPFVISLQRTINEYVKQSETHADSNLQKAFDQFKLTKLEPSDPNREAILDIA